LGLVSKKEHGTYIGIPKIFADATYKDGTGKDVPNPLFSAFNPNGGDHQTVRDATSQDMSVLPTCETQITSALQTEKSYFGDDNCFSNSVEQVHDSMHVWIGGDMDDISTSAFDPIFWMHHTNVDRLWARWQRLNPTSSSAISSDALSETLKTAPSLDWGTFKQQVDNIPLYEDTLPLNIAPVSLFGSHAVSHKVLKVTGFTTDVSRIIKVKLGNKVIGTVGVFTMKNQSATSTAHVGHVHVHAGPGKAFIHVAPNINVKSLSVESKVPEDAKNIKFALM